MGYKPNLEVVTKPPEPPSTFLASGQESDGAVLEVCMFLVPGFFSDQFYGPQPPYKRATPLVSGGPIVLGLEPESKILS